MLKITKVCLTFGMVFCSVHAFQGLSGVVLNDQNQPVDYATIRQLNSKAWTLTDEQGRFLIRTQIESSDSLEISRVGFWTKTVTKGDQSSVVIHLQQDIIHMKPVVVEGRFESGSAEWETEEITETDQISRNSVLQRIPGVLIKTYGGRAGITLLGLDGGRPEHTKIILDGIDLTSPQNGQADLSDVPKIFYQQLFLSRSPGIEFGSGSMDGVIHLRPWLNHSHLTLNKGSYGSRSGSLGYSRSFSKSTLNFLAGKSIEDGNYSYSTNGASSTRENNDFNQTFAGLQIRVGHSAKTFLNGSYFLSRNDRGVAGPVSWLSPDARRKNDVILSSVKVFHLFKTGHISLQMFRRSNDEHYFDPASDTSRHQVNTDNIRINWQTGLFSNMKASGLIETRTESIKSTDVGTRKRNIGAGTFSIIYSPFEMLMIRTGLRMDVMENSFKKQSYDLHLQLKLPFIGRIKGSIGTGFHLPNFNDLHWPKSAYTAGNPDLEAEESSYRIIGIDRDFLHSGNVSIEWRSRENKNLIVWTSGTDFVWRPVNLDKSSRENIILSFRLPEFIRGFSISGNMTQIKTKDHSTGKALAYVPEQTGLISFGISIAQFDVDIQGHTTGKRRYSGYDENFNTVEKSLDPFTDVTLGFHAPLPWFRTARLHIVAENLLDQDTSFFPDYPEPGWRVTAGLSVNF